MIRLPPRTTCLPRSFPTGRSSDLMANMGPKPGRAQRSHDASSFVFSPVYRSRRAGAGILSMPDDQPPFFYINSQMRNLLTHYRPIMQLRDDKTPPPARSQRRRLTWTSRGGPALQAVTLMFLRSEEHTSELQSLMRN